MKKFNIILIAQFMLVVNLRCSKHETSDDNEYSEFNGPMIEWEDVENSADMPDLIRWLSEGDPDQNPAYNFLNSEFGKHYRSRNISDSLLDNVDFKNYSGPLLERFRITFGTGQNVAAALEIGKYRPGKFQLIIKYCIHNLPEKTPSKLTYYFTDTLSIRDSILCTSILGNARNLHPIDTGLDENCFHEIEYYCAYPRFSTCFSVNCFRTKENKQYLQLLKDCSNLMQLTLSDSQLKESQLIDFINDVHRRDSTFNNDSISTQSGRKRWKFFTFNRQWNQEQKEEEYKTTRYNSRS